MPVSFIRALIQLKSTAAKANKALDCIDLQDADAIVSACANLDAMQDDELIQHFPVNVFQTGSGTSTNMNANEVIASLAKCSTNRAIHPNDHVNHGQSSNDVIPSSIHIAASMSLHKELTPALTHLVDVIERRMPELAKYCKTGRTHLMDAMPIRMDQVVSAWSAQINGHIKHLRALQSDIQSLGIGGTAVGTGVNAHEDFASTFNSILSKDTGLSFKSADNFFALISSQDTALALSAIAKSLAATLMKIANDLRWMNSGPLSGLGEISLPALQPGSSIMPGKVNPVIPESVAMAAAQVIGNDAAITVGAQSGNFELNVMLPMIASNLLSSLELLSDSSRLLADKAIAGFTVNQDKLEQALYKNPVLVTALNPLVGYDKAAKIAKMAYAEGLPVLDIAQRETDISRDELEALLRPDRLT